MDISEEASAKLPYRLKTAANLRSVLEKARDILAMSALTPIGSRLKTKSECSVSDVSDCGSQGSEYGYSALHEAVISHDLEYMNFLLKAGCDLEQRDENGFTALHVATLEKAVEAVDRLINAGSKVESLTKEGMSSLHIAVDIQDNNQVLSQLAALESNINIRNKVGRTALHLAARGGNLEYLKILLDAGCDREIKDKFGMRAVDAARAKKYENCVEFLLSYTPQKRNLGTSEDKNNSLEKQPYISRKLLLNGSPKLSANKTPKLKILDNDNDSDNLTLPEILVCELNQENVVEKARVLVEEEPRVTQLQICTIFDEQVMSIENSVKEQGIRENNVGKIDTANYFSSVKNKVEDCAKNIKQVAKNEKNVNGDTSERCGILAMKLLRETKEDIATSEQSEVRKADERCNSKTAPLSSVVLNKSGENGRSVNKCEYLVKNPAVENAPDMPLQDNKLDYNISDKECRASALHKTASRITIDSGELFKLLTRILELKRKGELRIDKKMKFSEVNRCNEECLALLRLIPVPFFSVKIEEEDFLRPWMLNGVSTNGWSMNGFTIIKHGLQPKKIISQVLKGLKLSMNGAFSTRSGNRLPLENKQELCQNLLQNGSETEKPRPRLCEDENLLELFVRACCTIQSRPSDSYAILEEFRDKISTKDRAELKSLTKKIFIYCNLSNCGVKSEVQSIDFRNCLEVLDHVVRCEKCPVYFVSSVLDSILTHRECINLVLESRAGFLEFLLNRTISCEEKIWDEEKIADIFMLFCKTLEDEVGALCRFVDVFLGQALSRCDINNMILSSFILVRMGLLKNEFKVEIIESLKGPLVALKHMFEQKYFPRSLAGLFVSFLAKPSPRFARVRDLHIQTLKSALLKEILPELKDQDANVLGKGLKRICDVLAHGEYWETADYCCDVLFIRALESTKLREVELGQSILVYFGLIKSEEKLETIKDIGNGLKLLQHVASGNHIPQSIALMASVFLNKEKKRLEAYQDDIECLINILHK